MSIVTTSLPGLPLEVQGHVLRFCDAPTLAVSSRVSLAFLELAGPLLYGHITISGKEQLEKLIRPETALLPALAPFVSLAQTRSFTYIPSDNLGDTAWKDASSKLVSTPLAMDELIIDGRIASPSMDQISVIRVPNLLRSFDPVHFRAIASPLPERVVGGFIDLTGQDEEDDEEDDGVERVPLPWTRLRVISFINSLGASDMEDTDLAYQRPLLDLVIDLSGSQVDGEKLEEDRELLEEDLRSVAKDLRDVEGAGRVGPAFGHVQVWVENEYVLNLAKKILVNCSCTALTIGVKKSTLV